jgi:magnesium and cobalt transporter
MKKRKINFLLNFFGKKTKKNFSSVLNHLLDSYESAKLIRAEEKKMFKNILSFGDKKVMSVMTPRSDIVAVEEKADLKALKKIITADGHTRIPVFRGDFDSIVGFVHSKDLAKFLCDDDENFSLNKIMRKILFVNGSMKLLDVLFRMRMARVHVAIVLDEFGGVDGLVTIENLMEEIVGDIEDEHDLPGESAFFRIRKISDNKFQFGGRVEIDKMEEILQRKIRQNDESFETVGGFVLHIFNQVPEVEQKTDFDDLKIKVLDADEKSVKLVEVEIGKS